MQTSLELLEVAMADDAGGVDPGTATPPDLERIRQFATGRRGWGALQGVPMGVFALVNAFPTGGLTRTAIALVVIPVCIGSLLWIHGYYRRFLGEVRVQRTRETTVAAFVLVATVLLTVLDPPPGALAVLFGTFVLAAWWRWRRPESPQLLLTAIALLALGAVYAVHPNPFPGIRPWLIILGIGVAVDGVVEHLTLMRFIRDQRRHEPDAAV